jgi:DNA repair protein RecO (recombination protein O)
MSLLRCEGLILRNLRMGDTSRVVTVLSRELGRFSAVAKGVRDPKSRFGASLEILSVASLIVYFRPGRDLQLISDGTLELEIRGLLKSSLRYHYGCAILESLDRLLEEESPVPEIYDLALRVLVLMEESPAGRLPYLLRAFQLRMAGWLGYAPRLDGCARCGSETARYFDAAAGTLMCGRCGAETGSQPLTDETIDLMRSLSGGSLPRAPSTRATRELEMVVEGFLLYHIDRYRPLRSLRALHDIGRLRHALPSVAGE